MVYISYQNLQYLLSLSHNEVHFISVHAHLLFVHLCRIKETSRGKQNAKPSWSSRLRNPRPKYLGLDIRILCRSRLLLLFASLNGYFYWEVTSLSIYKTKRCKYWISHLEFQTTDTDIPRKRFIHPVHSSSLSRIRGLNWQNSK